MPYKDKAKQLLSQRKHYSRNKTQRMSISRKRQDEIREYVRKAKEGKPCKDCNVVYPPYVMDFDHRNPTTKVCHPSFIYKKGWKDSRVQEELDKCDLVCSNCHRIRTYGKISGR